MGWPRARAEIDVEAVDVLELDEVEIVELDPEPRRLQPANSRPAEPSYLRDRRDPTGTAGIWRAIEGL
jgi:hypothetical protein